MSLPISLRRVTSETSGYARDGSSIDYNERAARLGGLSSSPPSSPSPPSLGAPPPLGLCCPSGLACASDLLHFVPSCRGIIHASSPCRIPPLVCIFMCILWRHRHRWLVSATGVTVSTVAGPRVLASTLGPATVRKVQKNRLKTRLFKRTWPRETLSVTKRRYRAKTAGFSTR